MIPSEIQPHIEMPLKEQEDYAWHAHEQKKEVESIKETAYREHARLKLDALLERFKKEIESPIHWGELLTNAVNKKFGPGQKKERFSGFDALSAATAQIGITDADFDFLMRVQKKYAGLIGEARYQEIRDIAAVYHALALHRLTEKVQKTGFEHKDLNEAMGLTDGYKQYYEPVQEELHSVLNYHLGNKLVVRLRTRKAEEAVKAAKEKETEKEQDEILAPYLLPRNAAMYPPLRESGVIDYETWQLLKDTTVLPSEHQEEIDKNGWKLESDIAAYYRGTQNEERQEAFIKYACRDRKTGEIKRLYFGSEECRENFYYKLYGRSYNEQYVGDVVKEGKREPKAYETYEDRLKELRDFGFETLRWDEKSRVKLKEFAEKRGWHAKELQELVHHYALTTDFGKYQLLKHIQGFARFKGVDLADFSDFDELIKERDVDSILAYLNNPHPLHPTRELKRDGGGFVEEEETMGQLFFNTTFALSMVTDGLVDIKTVDIHYAKNFLRLPHKNIANPTHANSLNAISKKIYFDVRQGTGERVTMTSGDVCLVAEIELPKDAPRKTEQYSDEVIAASKFNFRVVHVL